MELLVQNFHAAHAQGQGARLAATLVSESPRDDPNYLRRLTGSSTVNIIASDLRNNLLRGTNLSKADGNAWIDVFVAYFKASTEIVALNEGYDGSDETSVYEAWKEMTNALIRGYSSNHFEAWTIPCLYAAGRSLRTLAIAADKNPRNDKDVTYDAGMGDDITSSMSKNQKLEDAARVINRIFQLCISDRAPIEESRKWGLYYATNLLFKTYFKLNSISLSKNILRALQTSPDTPPETAFPRSQICTFHYYRGIISFLDEDYTTAETHLTQALNMCHNQAIHNKEMILTYLIPCHLLTTHTLPSKALLAPYPRLQKLFTPLATCIKRGDLAGFDRALSNGEAEFVQRRIYLTLERGRDIALRNLFRKVYLLGDTFIDGKAIRRTRIPIPEFEAAMSLAMDSNRSASHNGSVAKRKRPKIDHDEVECLLANMIYKGHMKGYISQEKDTVVLSSRDAFPGTSV